MTITTCSTTSNDNVDIPLVDNNKETSSSSSDDPTAVVVVLEPPLVRSVVDNNINKNNTTPTSSTPSMIMNNNNNTSSPSSSSQQIQKQSSSITITSSSSSSSPGNNNNNNNNNKNKDVVSTNTITNNNNTTTNSNIIDAPNDDKSSPSSSSSTTTNHKRQKYETVPQKPSKRDRRKRSRRSTSGGGTVGCRAVATTNDDTPDDQSSITIHLLDDVIPNYILRVVEPYPFTFATFVKKRWVGRSVLDVYHDEFGSFPRSYYEAAITEGRILVSSQPVPPTYILRQHDKLTHTVHRHEPAVALPSSSPSSSGDDVSKKQPLIPLLYETPSLLVVNKPCTVPIHPCGGYNFNSLFHILQRDYPHLKNSLYTVHRLDRLTSGVTVVAKSKDVAQMMGRCLMDRGGDDDGGGCCEKVYLARVKGRFPLGAAGVVPEWNEGESLPSFGEGDDGRPVVGYWIGDESGRRRRTKASLETFAESRTPLSRFRRQTDDGDDAAASPTDEPPWLHLACPTRITRPKVGQCDADSLPNLNPSSCPVVARTVKPAQTSFAILHYDARTDTTIVAARPRTGRTHQIRVHLRYLGHVIGNDASYGGDAFLGDEGGRERREEARREMEGMEGGCERNNGDTPATEEEVRRSRRRVGDDDDDDDSKNDATTTTTRYEREEGESLESFLKKTCVWCRRSRGSDDGTDGVTRRCVCEFLVRSGGIWLHALRYEFRPPSAVVAGEEDGGGEEDMRKTMVFVTDPPEWSVFEEG